MEHQTGCVRRVGVVAVATRGALRVEVAVVTSVLVASAALYGWHLTAVGWMNQYYAAVAQAGASNWTAWFFASPGIAGATATDKPPLAFWPMAWSARVFGLHPWSVALPQLLETLATILLLYLTVRLLAGRVAATVSAVVLATTPVVLVLARYNDPDSLLTLLITAAAYAAVRGARSRERRWTVVVGALLGLAFLTKWLIAFVPAAAVVAVLVRSRLPSRVDGRPPRRAGPSRPAWRAWIFGEAGRTLALASVVSAGVGLSWVLADVLTPASIRPYPDSPTGSILDVALAQDGVARLAGSGNPLSGVPGPLRLLQQPLASQVGWLLVAAVVALLLALVRARRSGRLPDGYLLFGGWLALTGAVFSGVGGAMHAYYTGLLAPAVAGLVGLGAARLWERGLVTPGAWRHRIGLLALLAGSGAYAVHLLASYPSLRGWAVVVAMAVAVALLVWSWALLGRRRGGRHLRAAAATLAGVALLMGPSVFAVSTLGHQVAGADPLAGPVETGDGHVPFTGSLVSYLRTHDLPVMRWGAAVPTSTAASTLQLELGRPVLTLGGFTGHAGFPNLQDVERWVRTGKLRFLVLAGPFIHGTVPSSLVTTPTGAAMAWALRHGCTVRVPGDRYTLLELASSLPCRARAGG